MAGTKAKRVCLTCVGGFYVYDSVQSLRAEETLPVWILGVDADPNASGQSIVDKFEVVPNADDDPAGFLERLISLCEANGIDAVILTSEAESRIVAARRNEFIDRGVGISVSDESIVERMTDKFILLEELATAGMDVGPFFKVDDEQGLAAAAEALGYPNRRFVLKPRRGSGSRGVLIFDADAGAFTSLLENRFCGVADYVGMSRKLLEVGFNFEENLAVPYYSTRAFDVDCVARQGDASVVVPRLREYKNPLSPFVEGCKVDLNPLVVEFVSAITKHFGVHGACDYDVAIDDQGIPRLMDASCRPSGSCGATALAGVNVLLQLVRVILDLPLANYTAVDGTRFRSFSRLSPVSVRV